ncbi:MAG: T9SS type A sorting domain-containing protein [Flammeovirgaceae bacterium]|nr:T9SS type A sorting domain-containing protein [Flammeovirgaceae bacterium]
MTSSANNAFGVFQWQIDTGSGFVDMVANTEYPNVTSQTLSFSALPSQNGNKYRVKVSSCTPDVISNEATVTVYTTPAITTQPASSTICAGENVTLTVVATGTSLTYQWRRNGALITDNTLYSGATTSQLTITGASALLTGSGYTCTITGASGCQPASTNSAVLTVNQFQITGQPVTPGPICVNGQTFFTTTATGPLPITYQWQESSDGGSNFTNVTDGGVYGGTNDVTLSLNNVPFSMNSFQYRCVVGSSCGTLNSNSATLVIVPVPPKPVITANLSNPETPVLTASGGITYQWFKNGATISGATDAFHNVSSEGSYTVQITDNGCLSPLSDPHVIIITGDLVNRSVSDVQLYPNPVIEKLTISLSKFSNTEPVAISITDILGRSMERSSVVGKTFIEVDVSQYQQGQYIVRLQQAQRAVVSQFIKSNR